LVFSNACPLRSLYLDGRGYSKTRLKLIESVETAAARLLQINHTSYYLPQVARMICFTDYLKTWYVQRGVIPIERIDVAPIYLPTKRVTVPKRHPRRVGFVALDFDFKGGPVLLQAWEIVRKRRADAELVIVGSKSQLSDAEAAEKSIQWLPRVPREQLIHEIFPSLDVFAYPTPFDGQPLVIMEAMSAGVAVATSDYQAVPELVGFGEAGLISPVGSATEMAENILRLLEPEANYQYRMAAKDRFEKFYSADAAQPKLLSSYEKALEYTPN
jgi:glycosyltransferase involved in cell wall biosynthesis